MKAMRRVQEEKPFLLVGCPPCTAFSSLFASNISRMDPKQVDKIIQNGLTHLKFCTDLYWVQVTAGRFFLHEHPYSAWSWKVPCIKELLELELVCRVRGDMCCFDMRPRVMWSAGNTDGTK